MTLKLGPVLIAASLLAACMAPVAAWAGPKENITVASRIFTEKMGAGRFDILDEIYGPGFAAHGGDQTFTLEEDNASARAIRAAFPDLKVRIVQILADGDYVTVWWSGEGTNTGASPMLPTTGKRAVMQGLSLFRFKDGRIVEEWSASDFGSVLEQLGLK